MKRRGKPKVRAKKSARRPKAKARKPRSGAGATRKARKASNSKSNSNPKSSKVKSRTSSRKKKPFSRKSGIKPSQSMVVEPLEQVTVNCANCGRAFSIVKLSGLSTEGMICQRCEVGEIEFPE